jgi:hypothetical protein
MRKSGLGIHLAQEKEKGRFVTRGEFLTSGEPTCVSVRNL